MSAVVWAPQCTISVPLTGRAECAPSRAYAPRGSAARPRRWCRSRRRRRRRPARGSETRGAMASSSSAAPPSRERGDRGCEQRAGHRCASIASHAPSSATYPPEPSWSSSAAASSVRPPRFFASRAGMSVLVVERRPALCSFTTAVAAGGYRLQLEHREELRAGRPVGRAVRAVRRGDRADAARPGPACAGLPVAGTDARERPRGQRELVERQRGWGVDGVELLTRRRGARAVPLGAGRRGAVPGSAAPTG